MMKRAEYARKSKLFRKNDIIVAVCVVIIAIVSIALAFRDVGETVEISYKGNIVYQLPLNQDEEIVIEGVGVIIISNSTVRMIDSTCPDKLCEHQGAISGVGESIICLPNRVVITIKGESEWDVIV